jgi:hypothetical protein
MSRWYYAKGDRQSGPISGQELKRLAEAGELLPTDLVWREGGSERKPAATVMNLFPVSTKSHTLTGRPHPESPAQMEPPAPVEGWRGEEAPVPPRGISFVGVAGFLTAMLSIFLGGGASFFYWTDNHRQLVLPIALLGLLLGNLVLLVDWLRDRARFSLSVLGVTLSTVAVLTAFWDAGGVSKTKNDVRNALARISKPKPSEPIPVPKSDRNVPEASGSPSATASSSVGPASAPSVSSETMTKEELITKIEALDRPCTMLDLFIAVGKPQQMETPEGQPAHLAWTWQCKDGKVEVILNNPEIETGENLKRGFAYIHKINEK